LLDRFIQVEIRSRHNEKYRDSAHNCLEFVVFDQILNLKSKAGRFWGRYYGSVFQCRKRGN